MKESGLDYTIVRPNFFFQNFVTYHSYSIKAGGLYLPQGNGKVSYIDVKDVAKSVATILHNPTNHRGKTYTLTGQIAYDTNQIVEIISNEIGKKLVYISIPDNDYVETMKKYHLPQFNIDTLVSLYQADREGINAIIMDDFEALTGEKPNTFEAFIKDKKELLT